MRAFTMVVVLTSVVAGCSGTTNTTRSSDDARTFAKAAMVDGPMFVRIEGTPFAGSQEALDAAVLDSVRKAMPWASAPQLTTDPTLARTPSIHMVLTFNGGVVSGEEQCRGESMGGEPQSGGSVQLTASFCGDNTVQSNTRGGIDASSGIDDPAFRKLLTDATNDLFPAASGSLVGGPGVGVGVGGGRGGVNWGTGVGIGVGLGF